jgi:hypothetical protein
VKLPVERVTQFELISLGLRFGPSGLLEARSAIKPEGGEAPQDRGVSDLARPPGEIEAARDEQTSAVLRLW